MAKRAVKKSTPAASATKRSTTPRSASRARAATGDYKDTLRNFVSNPTVKYVAGGIATAILARIATNLSERYPEISSFIKENLDGVEDRLVQFKDGLNGDSVRM